MIAEDRRPTFQEKIKRVQIEVEECLELILPLEEDTPSPDLARAIRYAALSPGKRIRAFIALEVAQIFNVDRSSALRVACALEIIHTFSLVHDDLPSMDNAHLRRGKPSLHVAFDEALAILAGDALLTISFETLAKKETCPNPETRTELILALTKAASSKGMCAGQAMDLYTENTDLDVETAIRLQRLKTGCLIGASCSMGAILGNAPEKARLALQGYAHDLGLAYQITDDLLDVEGASDEIGKPVGTDAILGKSNLVTLMGIERAKEQASMLVDQSITHLGCFGDKASYLRDLSLYILNRRY